MKQEQVQKIILNYFKDTDDKTLVAIIDSFVYNEPITDRTSNTSKLIEKFIDDNGLTTAYVNYLSDLRNPTKSFFSCSGSERQMIQMVIEAMLSLSYNRFRRSVRETETKNSTSKNNFRFIKKTVLEIFECLHRSENYIYGKEEDEKIVNKIEKLKHE